MRLFDLDDVPEVPLVRPPRRSRGEYDALLALERAA